MSDLLTRDEFREGVFERDNHQCVVCSAPAQDAHHLYERRLWLDGGYYLSNGVSLCGDCHWKAETTEYSVRFLAEKAGLKAPPLPQTLYTGEYDKWGNPYIGTKRGRGPLFYDASVQKVLKEAVQRGDFIRYTKYPRTPHLPWSPGYTDDDLFSEANFENEIVVVTEKMDGENTTIYRDRVHSRSIDTDYHWSRTWVKNLQGKIGYEIPENMRLCGENLQAVHSIKYTDLTSFFQGFSVWIDDTCQDWDMTEYWFEKFGIPTVKVLARGHYKSQAVQDVFKNWKDDNGLEGYVVRLDREFKDTEFDKSVAKYVRRNHITSNRHWKTMKIDKNELA